MQRRKASGDEAWLLSYADLITNLLIFFVMLLSKISHIVCPNRCLGLDEVVTTTAGKNDGAFI